MDTFEIMQRTEPSRIPGKQESGFSRNDVVKAFQDAFMVIGGTTRLALWGNQNPKEFFQLYSKLLPSTTVNLGMQAAPTIWHAIPPTPLDVHPGSENVNYVTQPQETEDGRAVRERDKPPSDPSA
jgi:hypothetical protein